MKRRFTKGFALGVICILVIVLGMGTTLAADHQINRFAGANRYETSALMSDYRFESADTVVIARGDVEGDYADALAGSYLAGVLEAPLLLTHPTIFYGVIEDEIDRLGATKAYILGGEMAVASSIEDALVDMGLETERLAGARRDETAKEIVLYAKESVVNGPTYLFVVNREATADALAAGSAAYYSHIPILLTYTDFVPQATEEALAELELDVVIIGGTSVVSDAVYAELEAQLRIAGDNRYQTSVLVAQVGLAEGAFADDNTYMLVRGADANLADGISAVSFGLPIIYVLEDTIPTTAAVYFEEVIDGFTHFYIAGGTAAIAESVAEAIEEALMTIAPKIGWAYIEDVDETIKIYAEIDNEDNEVVLSLGDDVDVQYDHGDALLSRSANVTVSDTKDGAYDLPSPGLNVTPECDFVEIIVDLYGDEGEPGVNGQVLLENSGTEVTFTCPEDPDLYRTYTIIVTDLI